MIEDFVRKTQRVGAAGLAQCFIGREPFDCGGEVLGGGEVEEGACLGFDDGVEGASGATRDDGESGRLGFDGGDPEIFYLRLDERGAGAEVVEDLRVWDESMEGDCGVIFVGVFE